MRMVLGQISASSGRVALVDAGLMGAWSFEHGPAAAAQADASGAALVDFGGPNAAVVAGIPEGTMQVAAMTGDDGSWRWVDLICWADRKIARADLVGSIIVDEARFMVADLDALSRWQHEQAMDGQADVAFWGRDADAVAAETGAGKLPEGVWGWADLSVAEATGKYRAVEARKTGGRLFMVDFRPHSHHFLAMGQVRASPMNVGHVDVDGQMVFVASTPHGDGMFPVYALRDAAGEPVGVRIVFSGEEGAEVEGIGTTLGSAGMPPTPMQAAGGAMAGAATGMAAGYAQRAFVRRAKQYLPKFLWPLLPGQRGTVKGALEKEAKRRTSNALWGCVFSAVFFSFFACAFGGVAIFIVYIVMTSMPG